MSTQPSQFFNVMVVGDNPDEIMAKYDVNRKVEPYIKYRYTDAKLLHESKIEECKKIIKLLKSRKDISHNYASIYEQRLSSYTNMTDFEYYTTLTADMDYDDDCNALSCENPKAEWETANIASHFALPLPVNVDGVIEYKYQAKAGDVNWDLIHLSNVKQYELLWKLFHKEVEPSNDQEKKLYKTIKKQKKYYNTFKNMDEFVTYNASYWNYAFVTEDKWIDADGYQNFEWIKNYYERFIKTLDKNAQITIYECTKPRYY